MSLEPGFGSYRNHVKLLFSLLLSKSQNNFLIILQQGHLQVPQELVQQGSRIPSLRFVYTTLPLFPVRFAYNIRWY